MSRYPTTQRGGLIKEKDRPNSFDFSMNLVDHNRLVMQLGSGAVNDTAMLEQWLQSIDCLEALMAGWWMTDTTPALDYRNAIKDLQTEQKKTNDDRRKIGHLKLRAIMVLQRACGFQGEKVGRGYFSKSAYESDHPGGRDESDE